MTNDRDSNFEAIKAAFSPLENFYLGTMGHNEVPLLTDFHLSIDKKFVQIIVDSKNVRQQAGKATPRVEIMRLYAVLSHAGIKINHPKEEKENVRLSFILDNTPSSVDLLRYIYKEVTKRPAMTEREKMTEWTTESILQCFNKVKGELANNIGQGKTSPQEVDSILDTAIHNAFRRMRLSRLEKK